MGVMTDKIRFVLDNALQGATITASANSPTVYIVNVNYGAVSNTVDGNTGWTVFFTAGTITSKAISKIVCSETIAQAQYFDISGLSSVGVETTYRVWYDIDANGTAPGFTTETLLPVAIATGDLDYEIATATRLAINTIPTHFACVTDNILPTMPLYNITSAMRSKKVRTIDSGDLTIDVIPNRAYSVSSFIIYAHTLPNSLRYSIELYNSNVDIDNSKLIYNSGWKLTTPYDGGTETVPWGAVDWGYTDWGQDNIGQDLYRTPSKIVFWLPREISGVRLARIKLSTDIDTVIYCSSADYFCSNDEVLCSSNGIGASAASIPYFEFGKVILGKYIEPKYNISYGHDLTWIETTKQYRTESGSLRSDQGIPFRQIEFDLNTIVEDDRILLQNGFRDIGLRRDFFVSVFPNDDSIIKANDYSALVKITKEPKFTEYHTNLYKSKYIMEEV